VGTERVGELQRVYDEEHAAAAAVDSAVVRRQAFAAALESEVFLVGQALAKDTQRLSGLPYVFPGGPPYRLSKGGQVLDAWLAEIGYSVAPDAPDRRYAYHADLHPGFPGRQDTTGDVVPTAAEIAAGAAWLRREIEAINPKVVICLGKEPALEILRRYNGKVPSEVGRAAGDLRKLREATGRRWEIVVGDRPVVAFAVYHPSGAFQFPSQSEAAWHFARDELQQILGS
jgi:uracil-DNA glycosylase family 4